MKSYFSILLIIVGLNSNGQGVEINKSIKQFIDSNYNIKPNPLSYEHKIDTIIKLRNGNYFIFYAEVGVISNFIIFCLNHD